jgi:hypothetical protein
VQDKQVSVPANVHEQSQACLTHVLQAQMILEQKKNGLANGPVDIDDGKEPHDIMSILREHLVFMLYYRWNQVLTCE